MTTLLPVDVRFHHPRRPVEILALGPDPEAAMLRAVLERFGATVLLHLPGTPGDILDVLDRPGTEPSLLIISGHGDDQGFVVEEIGEGLGIDTSMLGGNRSLPPSAIAGRAHLHGWTVLSTGCLTGSGAMADAFRRGDVAALIGPEAYPDGTDTTLFAIQFRYELIVRKRTFEDAWRPMTSGAGCSFSTRRKPHSGCPYPRHKWACDWRTAPSTHRPDSPRHGSRRPGRGLSASGNAQIARLKETSAIVTNAGGSAKIVQAFTNADRRRSPVRGQASTL